ncbi:zinc finger MYND domain-containing protein 10 [Patella vulgata]|uniref:zinc finger MYND domain-containing protein 10 n=1 Tax=Patella vulgata TaxID=6465 RepID=UPI0021800BC0|nr:zinc finger MYND domain-containing protein 10 [Patella vulgata]
MIAGGTHVLMPVEAEAFIEELTKIDLKDVGNTRWSQQHERIEKINMQAVVSATQQSDEFVKEFLITFEKLPLLIHDLIVTETWKEKIFPELVAMKFEPKITFPLYIALYHEATVSNLLETVMYHRDACEAAEDGILDLLDYCYRKLTHMIALADEYRDDEEEEKMDSKSVKATCMKDLVKQKKTMEFEICVKAISLLRYITDHMEGLPLSITTRLLNTLDIPVLLVELIENPPWSKRQNGKIFKYIDNKWAEVSRDEMFQITKIEGQVWISIFHVLMDQNCQHKYDMNSYRKNVILKLRAYINEMLLDQLPILGELQRYLEHLSMMEPPAAKQDLVLEQVPEIRDTVLKENEGKWQKLAVHQSKTHFNPSPADIQQQAKRWADTYNMDVLEGLLTDPPKCAVCGEPASKRCSRCQNEWYCRRECQVNHWAKHKKACNLMFDSLKADKNNAVCS